ncbi:MAG: EAL domain-containing protein [Methylococcales bacterium]
MIKLLRNLPIDRKLLLILIFSGFASVILAGALLVMLEISEFQRNTRDDLSALAEIVGNRSTAALTFDDQSLAVENLTVFNNIPAVQSACFYNNQGVVFAQLHKNVEPANSCPEQVSNEITHFQQGHLYISQAIKLKGENLGTIYIHADLRQAYWRKIQFIGMLFLVLVGASILTLLLAKPLLKIISAPIQELVDKVKEISRTKDYSLRANVVNNDEIGVLVHAFNNLITTVDIQNQALLQAKNRYLALYDDNPTIVFNLKEDGRILSVNRTGAVYLGVSIEELQDRLIFDFIYEGDIPLIYSLFERCRNNPAGVHKQELRNLCQDGRIIWLRETARWIESEHQQSSLLLVGEDITETRWLNEQLIHQATHDALTNLPNRVEFHKRIEQAVSSAQVNGSEHAVCYLDLDQFKVINDTSGHFAGDDVLRQLGDLLRKKIRKYDCVARLGGDEFGILMNDCSVSEAAAACENLRDLIRDFRFASDARSFTIGVSIGIAIINSASNNAVTLLKEADAACYAAKDKGRNRVHVFRPDDEELAMRYGEMQWVEKIQHGIAENLFCLFGQPIVALNHHEPGLHFETLVRYKDIDGHIIPPGAFLPAAERYNMAPALDRWVISNLFAWMANAPDFLEQLAVCSVNLSGLSLSDETMLNFILQELDKWSIPKHKICFEITETAAITNLAMATQFIDKLRAQGCLFSLDDFGSGLSSFAYLRNLPVDFLKIDGLFVKDILDDKIDLAMVKSINDVGHIMDKKTIAEFVENQQIFDLLKELHVDYAQGYGISKPVPLNELTLIKAHLRALT